MSHLRSVPARGVGQRRVLRIEHRTHKRCSSYASTLITSGTIRALNTNAISTGPLTLDIAGDLRLNGNDLTVSNLTSINSGQVTGTAATIQNTHATIPATLTVGTDNTSTTFDGVFLNGGAAPLGLTKIGNGTLTLSAASTNTGTVTVNGGTLAMVGAGSFANASRIIAGGGGTYDVTTTGSPLTLNSGQTLSGSGTVKGGVIASAGSTIAPGNSVGTLTVVGNVTLGGNLLMELNRTNSQTCDHLVSSGGTITYGGSLVVTNIGPALQANDTFQLFLSGVGGFGANITLATTDANGVVYTWENDIATSGSVKVLSVTSAVNLNPPQIQMSVTATTLHLGWPTNAGWTLLTNNVGLTATNQWFPYPNSANLTNVDITLDPTKPNVYFRMVYPYP